MWYIIIQTMGNSYLTPKVPKDGMIYLTLKNQIHIYNQKKNENDFVIYLKEQLDCLNY